ncbi:MAG: hypothetical protein C0467_01660 [Planctomycetaceae bacterium]|nr:hypothetical protein [Planctomycetaceae bacterium]
MSIKFNCPHCQFAYRLPDKLAGSKAKCKNPECRKLIVIPSPVTIPDDAAPPMPDAATLEAAALNALSDEPPKVTEVPVQEKVIPMTCTFCEHKWTEPWAKGGKNTLCPNPECRQRQRVPEPKEDVPTDWRQQKSKLPTLAKQNFEKLEGVVSAGDIGNVSGGAIREAGVFDDLIDPVPLKQKILVGVAIFGLVASVIFGIWYLRSSRIEKSEDRLMADARDEFDKKAVPELSPTGAGLSSAVLNAAAAEYSLDKALENADALKLKEAQTHFDKARGDLRKQPPSLDRNAVAAELALAVFAFAGTDEQVKAQLRYRWQPDTESGRAMRLNERSHTIHQELATTLQLLLPADYDFRIAVARRLTRELVKRGQAGMAVDLLPVAMFTEQENSEARAVIALEIFRADKTSPLPRQVADELKAAFASGAKGNPFPASAQTLFTVLTIEKALVVVSPPPPSGPIQNFAIALAQAGVLLLDDKPEPALALAQRVTQPEQQMKVLMLCAEWAKDPGPALDAVTKLITDAKGQKQITLSPSHVLRLSQIAAISGKHEQSKTLADSLADDGLKAWAKGDAVRLRLASNPAEKADENWVELPDDPKKVRAGHAWGRMWVARQNAKESQNPNKERKATANWPPTVRPFALAGIALGLQDK